MLTPMDTLMLHTKYMVLPMITTHMIMPRQYTYTTPMIFLVLHAR